MIAKELGVKEAAPFITKESVVKEAATVITKEAGMKEAAPFITKETGMKEAAPVITKELGVTDSAPVQVMEPQSSPEEAGAQGREHRVTVQVHRDTSEAAPVQPLGVKEPGGAGHVTVIQLNQAAAAKSMPAPATSGVQPSREAPALPRAALSGSKVPHESTSARSASVSTPASATSSEGRKLPSVSDQVDSSRDLSEVTEPPPDMSQTSPNSTQQFASQVVSFSSPIMSTKVISSANNNQQQQSKIPLLPPPPPSSKPKARQERNTNSRPPVSGCQGGLLPPDDKLKSKSLPRGLPSDGTLWSDSVQSQDQPEDTSHVSERASEKDRSHQQKEALIMEELRLKFEYEELMTMKSELERKKRTERREIAELQEEIATMQTLYQYR